MLIGRVQSLGTKKNILKRVFTVCARILIVQRGWLIASYTHTFYGESNPSNLISHLARLRIKRIFEYMCTLDWLLHAIYILISSLEFCRCAFSAPEGPSEIGLTIRKGMYKCDQEDYSPLCVTHIEGHTHSNTHILGELAIIFKREDKWTSAGLSFAIKCCVYLYRLQLHTQTLSQLGSECEDILTQKFLHHI